MFGRGRIKDGVRGQAKVVPDIADRARASAAAGAAAALGFTLRDDGK
jgi:hypothetical protein